MLVKKEMGKHNNTALKVINTAMLSQDQWIMVNILMLRS